MAADPLQVLEAFVTAVRNLTSGDSYKAVASIFDQVPLLKGQIESKDIELDRHRNEINDLKSKHESHRQEELDLYCTQRNKLEAEKTSLSEKISSLSVTIQQSGETVAELNRTNDGLRGQLDQAQKALDGEKGKVAAANTKITDLQQSLKAKDAEIEKLKESLRSEKGRLSSAESQLLNLQKEKTSLQQNLQLKTGRLSEVEGFATELHDLDEEIWINKLDKLWETARQLVESHFMQDLPESNLEGLVKNLKESPYQDSRDSPIPLPRSNSPAAKRMRIAAMLAILARSIDTHIFLPTYILDEDEEIRPLLVRLAVKDSKKESFCRALLLSIDPEEQTKRASERVERVIREILQYVLPIGQYESFKSGLELLVKQACDFWRIVQYATEKYEPHFDLDHYADVKWQPLRFDDGEKSPTKAPDADEELLVIFPRIYLIEDDEPEPATDGVVLMKSQSAAAAEEEAAERRKPSSPTLGKAMPRSRTTRVRNKSMSLNGGNGFLSQTAPSNAH